MHSTRAGIRSLALACWSALTAVRDVGTRHAQADSCKCLVKKVRRGMAPPARSVWGPGVTARCLVRRHLVGCRCHASWLGAGAAPRLGAGAVFTAVVGDDNSLWHPR